MVGFPPLFEIGCLLGVDVSSKVDICSHYDTGSLLLDDFDEASDLKSLATKATQDFCHKWQKSIKYFHPLRSKILGEILSGYSRVKEHAFPALGRLSVSQTLRTR